MLRNGLYFVADEAVRVACEPLGRTYRASFVLGALREDVIRVPLLGFSEYPSFSHFGGCGVPGGYLPLLWPGPRGVAERLFRRFQRAACTGQLAHAFVTLGRISHVLADVSIPSHVHRAAHERDPFEWWVEGNLSALNGRVAELPLGLESAPALVESLARRAYRHLPDRTNTPWGRRLRRAGMREPVRSDLARQQALELIPEAVAHTAALLRLACKSLGPAERAALVGCERMRDEEQVLLETLDALELPRRMLRPWFSHNRAFCEKHGGRRVYKGLLELLDRCDAALEQSEASRAKR